MIIDEHIGQDGQALRTHLLAGGPETFRLQVDGELDVELSLSVLDRVMARYGKELAEETKVDGPALALPGGRTVIMIRHLARYDVIARDFFVLARDGEAPVAELSTSVAAALLHLARASEEKNR
jgi:hypothetical protein